MKNNIYTVLDEFTDQYVPDKWADIMTEIAKQPEQKSSTPMVTVIRSNNKWKYTVAAACLCAIIASGAMLLPNFQNSIVVPNTTIDNTASNSAVITDRNDVIHWNNVALNNNRLAFEFKEVTKEEWLSHYPVSLPNNENAAYYLVYNIYKDISNKDEVVLGYIDFNFSNNSDITMYVDNAPLHLSDNMLIDYFGVSNPKESYIDKQKVYLGAFNTKRCAVFNNGNYSFYVQMSNIQADKSIELLKGFLK